MGADYPERVAIETQLPFVSLTASCYFILAVKLMLSKFCLGHFKFR